MIDRILGNVLTKGRRTGHQLFGLFRLVTELSTGLFLFNLGNIEGIADDAVDLVGSLKKNHGGLIAMDPVRKAQMKAKMYRGGGLVVY